MKHYAFDQGSPEWLQCRAGKITASRCKDARDTLKSGKPSAKQTAYAAQVAVERISGAPIDQVFENWQMREGHVQEPEARAAYEALTGNLVTEVGALATDDDVYLYSPDGMVGEDGLIEIKSLFSAERICNIVGNADTSDFIDQCNFGLWLTGRKWIDLCIWAPALTRIGLELTVVRIERDDDVIEAMEADLLSFFHLVETFEHSLRAQAARKQAAAALAAAAVVDALPAPECTHTAEQQQFETLEQSEIKRLADLNNTLIVEAHTPLEVIAIDVLSPPTLKLGQIADRLGFALTADFLKSLGFEPAATDKGAKLFHENDFHRMCAVLVRHIQTVAQGVPA